MHQARFPLTDWAGSVQEVSRSILVHVTGILRAFLYSLKANSRFVFQTGSLIQSAADCIFYRIMVKVKVMFTL